MKLHKSVVDKIIYYCTTFGGYDTERKLREKINELDFTPYERKEAHNGEVILVLTEDYIKQIEGKRNS